MGISRRVALIGLSGTVAVGLGQSDRAYTTGTTANDLRQRSHEVHWPKEFSPDRAQYFAHNELPINADCRTVWDRMIHAGKWQDWLITVKDIRLPAGHDALSPGLSFQWNVLDIETRSTVGEFVVGSRLGWYAFYGPKPTWYHTWLFTPTPGGCTVVTEEVGLGPEAARLTASGDTGIHRAHDLWLASLRWASGA